jgi:hypothetical protein
MSNYGPLVIIGYDSINILLFLQLERDELAVHYEDACSPFSCVKYGKKRVSRPQNLYYSRIYHRPRYKPVIFTLLTIPFLLLVILKIEYFLPKK